MGFILADRRSRSLQKRMATSKSFPRTHDLIQSGQRQVAPLIECKDAYNMQIVQEWNTFRWSRVTLLSDPTANLIRIKVHVFSQILRCVLGSRIQIHQITGQQNWRMYVANTGLSNKSNWQSEKCKLFGTCYPVRQRRRGGTEIQQLPMIMGQCSITNG